MPLSNILLDRISYAFSLFIVSPFNRSEFPTSSKQSAELCAIPKQSLLSFRFFRIQLRWFKQINVCAACSTDTSSESQSVVHQSLFLWACLSSRLRFPASVLCSSRTLHGIRCAALCIPSSRLSLPSVCPFKLVKIHRLANARPLGAIIVLVKPQAAYKTFYGTILAEVKNYKGNQ